MHITSEQLQLYAIGRLSPREADHVERHLDECHECGELFDQIDVADDPLVKSFQDHSASANDVPAVALSPRERLPARLGRYEINRELGRGGMGIVYECHDPTLRRQVALKVILPHRVCRDDVRARFRVVEETGQV